VDCPHDMRALRRRTIANGTCQFVRQCVQCGNPGPAIKRMDAVSESGSLDAIEPFDETLQERWWSLQRDAAVSQREGLAWERDQQHREWLAEHDRYLRTEEWQRKRLAVMARARGICEGCLQAQASQVHHLTYSHWKDELLFQLVALCRECHERAHERQHA
jgi:hypothetical protein